MASLPTSPCLANGLKDSLSPDMKTDICIGKLWSPSARKRLCKEFAAASGVEYTQSSPGLKLRTNMLPKKTPELKEPASSWGPNPFAGTPLPIGKLFGPPPSPEIWKKSLPTFELFLIGQFEQLAQTTHLLSEWCERVKSTGVRLEQGNPLKHGTMPVWTHSAKIRGLNSGVVINLRKTLSLMNFVEALTFHTYCDGSIVTRSEWRSKEVLNLCYQVISGLPAI